LSEQEDFLQARSPSFGTMSGDVQTSVSWIKVRLGSTELWRRFYQVADSELSTVL